MRENEKKKSRKYDSFMKFLKRQKNRWKKNRFAVLVFPFHFRSSVIFRRIKDIFCKEEILLLPSVFALVGKRHQFRTIFKLHVL